MISFINFITVTRAEEKLDQNTPLFQRVSSERLTSPNSDIVTLSMTTIAAYSCPKCCFCAGESFASLSVTNRSRKQDAIVALRADGQVRG